VGLTGPALRIWPGARKTPTRHGARGEELLGKRIRPWGQSFSQRFPPSDPAGRLTAVTIGAFLIILGIVLLIIDWTVLGIVLVILGLLFGGFRRGRWY
jgi:hypothetical protein